MAQVAIFNITGSFSFSIRLRPPSLLRITQRAWCPEFAYLVAETPVSLIVSSLDCGLFLALLTSEQGRDSGLAIWALHSLAFQIEKNT